MITEQENEMVVRVQSLGEAADFFYRFLSSAQLTEPECTIFPHKERGVQKGSINLLSQNSLSSLLAGPITFTSADVPGRRPFRVKILQQDIDEIVAVAGLDSRDMKRIVASYNPRESKIIVSFPSENTITGKHKELVNALME